MLRFYRQKRNILFSDDGESFLSSHRTEMSKYSIKRVKVESLIKYQRTEQLVPYFMSGLNAEIM